MNWFHIWTLYRRELRVALRERSIVVNSLLLPVFLYPVVLWLTFSAFTFVQGLAEGYVSRVAAFDVPAGHVAVLDSLRARTDVELVAARRAVAGAGAVDSGSEQGAPAEGPPTDGTSTEGAPAAGTSAQEASEDGHATAAAARQALRTGELDAVLEFLPPDEEGALLEGNFGVRISYDRSQARSQTARSRLAGIIQRHRDRWIEERAGDLGLSEAELGGFRIQGRNVSSGTEVGAFVLAEMVPVFLVVMVALGCFVPAIDSTAGERERGTWETLMTVAASRTSVVTAKYLYVATLGTVAGVLNILAMTLSVGAVLGPLVGQGGGAVPTGAAGMSFQYPPQAVPVMVLGAVILALFFAAAMMILASFARTFRDGQSMVTPIYWLALVPVFLGQAPDQRLTAELALVPIANTTLMIRDAIQGIFSWPLILESFLVGLVMVAACIRLARWILEFEDVLVGSYDGSFWRFLRERARSRRRASP